MDCHERKIPLEIEVAPRYTLFTLFTQFTRLLTLFALLTILTILSLLLLLPLLTLLRLLRPLIWLYMALWASEQKPGVEWTGWSGYPLLRGP